MTDVKMRPVNPLSLKTRDKIDSEPTELKAFGVPDGLPSDVQSEVSSYDELHGKDIKNLKKVKGKVTAKRNYQGGKNGSDINKSREE